MMNAPFKRFTLVLTILMFLLGCQLIPTQAQPTEPPTTQDNQTAEINVLVFTKTEGFRHSSIEPAKELLQQKAGSRNWAISFTEDGAQFNSSNLAQFDAVVFLLTSGDVLTEDQQAAFESYIRSGGGYAGVHSASDTEYDWPWYGELVGAYFDGHPPIQTAVVNKTSVQHPSTSSFPSPWEVRDEWYNFRTNPADDQNISVLLLLDESTYNGGEMGPIHPIAWYQEFDGGRSWYTGAGHRNELYSNSEHAVFQDHVIAGIEWAAGLGDEAGLPLQLTIFNYLPTITN